MAVEPGLQTLPITFAPGVVRASTATGVGAQWYDSHLIRWAGGRLRPINGWEKFSLAPFASPLRAIHIWVDNDAEERAAFLCERHLYVLVGPDLPDFAEQFLDITPAGGIAGPGSTLTTGGYGNDKYGANDPGELPLNTYGTPRGQRADTPLVGEVWRLSNWGEDLLAMASTDGRLLRWKPSDPPGTLAAAVPSAPVGNRTFIVTPERHVMLFGMGTAGTGLAGGTNIFGWCSQEDIDDWNFLSVENTAGFYAIEPHSRIINAMAAQYSIIFWTIEGAYVVNYKALPYIYTYSFLGQYTAPISGQAPAAYSGIVMWPAPDGFWRFDGSSIAQVPCPILDWFQQTYDDAATRSYMGGWYNGFTSELWWCFPHKPLPGEPAASHPDTLIVYNFQEKWWSIGKLRRVCGYPGSIRGYPIMASETTVYRHERGHVYPDCPDLPWIRSGYFGIENGTVMATTKQLLVDTEADLDTVSYQLFAAKGRYKDAPERTKGPKVPLYRWIHPKTSDTMWRGGQGKIDYRISGRDFSVKMQMLAPKEWSFGQGQVLVTPRGRRGGP
jgi:hypothetical protein